MEQTKIWGAWSQIVLAVIAVFAVLDVLESVFAPSAFALVMGVVLSPLSDFWERRGYSTVVGAMLGLTGTLVVLACLVLIFQPVVAQLLDQAPKVWADMQETVKMIQGLLRGLVRLADDVQKAVAIAPAAEGAGMAPPTAPVPLPSVTDALLAAPAILSQILIFSGVLFFFLLSRRNIYEWIAAHWVRQENRVQCVLTLLRAERVVSRYFLTVTIINASLGGLMALILQVLSVPGAVLWGLVAFLLNYVPYLGAAICMIGLLFAGVATFDGWAALLPTLVYTLLNTIESQFVTPTLVGRTSELNSLVVFLALIIGIWLWGATGGIVAIPLLLWALVLADSLPRSLAPVDRDGATE